MSFKNDNEGRQSKHTMTTLRAKASSAETVIIAFDSLRLTFDHPNGNAAHLQNVPVQAWHSLTGDINALSINRGKVTISNLKIHIQIAGTSCKTNADLCINK